MKYSLLVVLCLAAMTSFAQRPKAVFIIVDGIPADVIESVNTTTLDQIEHIGGYTRAYVGGQKGTYSETPTISAPGYINLLTGTWANKHNVTDNYDQSPNYNYWNIFRIAEAVDSSIKTAIFSTWLDNRTVLVGEGQPDAGQFKIDYAFDGLELDTVQYPHDKNARYIFNIDEQVSQHAAEYIRNESPDLSWVYLEYTDDVGHDKGDSPAFIDAVLKADNQVKRIWEAVQYRQALGENWLIVVTTDHGRDSLTGQNHGGQSARERLTWISTNASGLNSRFNTNQIAITDITPSILSYMGIEAPTDVLREMDGTAFIGPVSIHNLSAKLQGDQLTLQWLPVKPNGVINFQIAFSNQFATSGIDAYQHLGSIPVQSTQAVFTLNTGQMGQYKKSGFLKIVAEAPYNFANCWITE